ncbi:MAG: cytochrome c [Thermodesulfobacteriota bacterium]|nr:cytochrome c [Thermodesulfobacteriota bacterium]
MNKVKIVIGIILLAFCMFGTALALTEADEAKAMVEKASALVKSQGKDKALSEISTPNGQFVKGEMYVFAYDMTATVVAHPINSKLIGKNLFEVPDADGKYFRKEVVELAKTKGNGWVDYKYKNPQTSKIEAKTTYILKEGEIVLCCGIYK